MDKPRCSKHQDRQELPRLCSTCQRIAVEQDIVTRTVDALLGAGYLLQTNIQWRRPANPTSDRGTILAQMMAVDDEFLGVHRPGDSDPRPFAWVRFVYGNDGWDVMSDYTTNLEDVLAPVNEYADSLDA